MSNEQESGFNFAAAYNQLNAADDDYRFYADLARSLGAARAIDLGCGTGTLARLLASSSAVVVGIDPDPDMIRVAHTLDPEQQVSWLLGYSADLQPESADFIVMSGHVAQVFIDDDTWMATLEDLHRALVPGGHIAFESRDPRARKWETWDRGQTRRTVSTSDGEVEFWHQTTHVALPLVTYDTTARNLDTGVETVDSDTLAFRDEETLLASLDDAAFEVVQIFGGWDRVPTGNGATELIFVAQKPRSCRPIPY